MPYTKEQARNRSELYTRILDAERIALERDVENAKQKRKRQKSVDLFNHHIPLGLCWF